VPLLKSAPKLMAITLLRKLQDDHPERFPDGMLRTLQRHVRQWRALEGPSKEVFFPQEHAPGHRGLSDFTAMGKLCITITGAAFVHIPYHFVLAFSRWEHVEVVEGGESFEALSKGLQNALRLAAPGAKPWLEQRRDDTAALGTTQQPHVLIVGGGRGGIALGARLRRLGAPPLIVEKDKKPGDSWRKRYKRPCLQDPVWQDHLPYPPFPDDWPVFAPKDPGPQEGELRNMWKPTRVPNLWFLGGGTCTSRATARSSCRCSSRHAWKAFRRPCTGSRRRTTSAERAKRGVAGSGLAQGAAADGPAVVRAQGAE